MQNVLFHKEKKEDAWYKLQGCKYYIVSMDNIDKICTYLKGFDVLSFDIETTGFDVFKNKIVGFSICPKIGIAFYFPINNYDQRKNLSAEELSIHVWPLLTTKKVVGHNLKFDYKFILYKYGARVNIVYDTYVISRLLDCFDSNGLKNLGYALLNIDTIDLDSIKKEYELTYSTLHLLTAEEMFEYCCQDSDLSLRLLEEFPKWGWEETDLFRTEMDLIPVLVDIELKGIKINHAVLCEVEKEIIEKLEGLEDKIYAIAGRKFNIQSNKQFLLAFIAKYPTAHKMFLYDEKTGNIKMAKAQVIKYRIKFKEYLKETGSTEENIFKLFEDRKVTYSLLTKYISPWKERIVKDKSDVIHSTISSLVAATGRMSCSEPNLQQVTSVMKKVFVPRIGTYFVEVDFKQVEYRILAALAGLDHLVEKMNTDAFDIHKEAASLLYQIPEEEVTEEKRKLGKTLNFGVLYGMGVNKLADSLGRSVEEATELKNMYDTRFLRNTKWFERVLTFARKKGYVLTSYGRKRRIDNIQIFPDRYSEDYTTQKKLYSAACREAVNTPIQGTSADITKMSTVKIDRYLKENEIPASLLMIVHDSFLFEVSTEMAPEEFILRMKECIEFKFKDKVNLPVDSKVSFKSWGDLIEQVAK
jgi:DNA polymerase-1